MSVKRIVPAVLVVAAVALALWVQQRDDSDSAPDSTERSVAEKTGAEATTERTGAAEPRSVKKRSDSRVETTRSQLKQPAASRLKTVIENVTVRHYRKVVYRGAVDLSVTIARIKRGEKYRHRNDGGVFKNRERRLPSKPRGYYHEYVHPTKGIRGPGPQRLVVGRAGEWYYTADHYRTFIRIDR